MNGNLITDDDISGILLIDNYITWATYFVFNQLIFETSITMLTMLTMLSLIIQFKCYFKLFMLLLICSYTHLANLYKGRNKGATNSLRNVYDVSMYNSIMLHCALFTRTVQCSAGICVYVSCGNQLFVSYQFYACTILCYLHIYSGITVQVQKSCKSSIRHNILDHYFHCIITAYVFKNIIHVTGMKSLNDILITYLVHRIIINSSYISSCTNSYKNICKCTFFRPNQYFIIMYYINKQLGPFLVTFAHYTCTPFIYSII